MGCALLLYAPMLVWTAAGPHGGATVLLAFLLPTLLATSPNLRRFPPFPAWAFAVLPGMIGLGGVSAGLNGERTTPLLGLAILGACLFLGLSFRKPHRPLALAVLGVCALLVAYFSGARGGPGPMLNLFEGWGFSRPVGEALTIAVRKTIHFAFYGTIGLSALLAARRAGAERSEAIRTALLAALAVAVCDEMRQASYANRSGSPVDVLLDFTGTLAFVGLSEWRRARTR